MIIPINLAPIWHHTQLLDYYWLYSLYCTLHPHDYSMATNLNFLIPSPILPIPLKLLPSGNHQNILCFCSACSFILFFFRFNFWWICIYCHFIAHIFYLLPKEDPLTCQTHTGLVVMNSISFFLSGTFFLSSDSKW